MDARRTAKAILACLIILSLRLAVALDISAQAWLPPKGEGSLSLSYQNVSFDGHFDSSGHRLPLGSSQAQNAILGLEYGITDRVAVSVSLPYVASKYTGKSPSSAELRKLFDELLQQTNRPYRHSFLDDGSYHSTLQDFRFDLRYNILKRPFVLTPFVGAAIPSHDYAIVGEAAPGHNLRELLVGINLGRRLDPIWPNAFVHGQYSYAFVERDLGVPLNRSNAEIALGYFLSALLSVRVLGSWQHTHGGLHLPQDLTTPELFLTHDRLLRVNFWHIGGGAQFSVNQSVDIYAAVITFLSGSDTHFGKGITIGTSWNFSRGSKSSSPPEHFTNVTLRRLRTLN